MMNTTTTVEERTAFRNTIMDSILAPVTVSTKTEEAILMNTKTVAEVIVAAKESLPKYAVGSYVMNKSTGHISKVGTDFTTGKALLVKTQMYMGKGVALKEVIISVESLNNTKVFVPMTNAEVSAEINKVVVVEEKNVLEVSKSATGYRNWTSTNTTTGVVTELSEGNTVHSLIKSYTRKTTTGSYTKATVKVIKEAPAKEVKKVTTCHVCSCCGKEVSAKVFNFVKNSQAAFSEDNKHIVVCFGCQKARGMDVESKVYYATRKTAKVMLPK